VLYTTLGFSLANVIIFDAALISLNPAMHDAQSLIFTNVTRISQKSVAVGSAYASVGITVMTSADKKVTSRVRSNAHSIKLSLQNLLSTKRAYLRSL